MKYSQYLPKLRFLRGLVQPFRSLASRRRCVSFEVGEGDLEHVFDQSPLGVFEVKGLVNLFIKLTRCLDVFQSA